MKRTTVPFMYNLDDNIEGLDVVDFPGVDDRDESISGLADLLLTLAQIVIFVVDYRYCCLGTQILLESNCIVFAGRSSILRFCYPF